MRNFELDKDFPPVHLLKSMGLTKCQECGKEISSWAVSCPHCGFPLGSTGSEAVPPQNRLQPTSPIKSPPPTSISATDKGKIKKGRLGCAGTLLILFVIVGIIGNFVGDDNVPKKMQITKDFPCFRELSDLEYFHTQTQQAAERIIDRIFRGRKLWEVSESESAEVGKEVERETEIIKSRFADAGRLWDIPAGTEIKITKCYDDKGHEISPVWNAPQKTFYTADGNFVRVAGEWNGKTVYTALWPGGSN